MLNTVQRMKHFVHQLSNTIKEDKQKLEKLSKL